MSVPRILCMVWFRAEHWDQLLSMFSDRHVMPATYEKWLQKAEAAYRQAKGLGGTVIKVDIDPQRFGEWCRQRSMNIDAKARTQYAQEIGYRAYCDGRVE